MLAAAAVGWHGIEATRPAYLQPTCLQGYAMGQGAGYGLMHSRLWRDTLWL